MEPSLDSSAVYAHSDEVVARVIEGELLLVPLKAGIGEEEGELFALNSTGRAIWDKLDGNSTVTAISESLSAEFQIDPEAMLKDVSGLLTELLSRRIIVAR